MSYDELDSSELHFSSDPDLPKEQQWFIALGSFLSAYNGDYVNDIKTRYDEFYIKEGLSSMWGIIDKETFKETANWLITTGHRAQYLPRLELVKKYCSEINNANNFFKLVFKLIPRLSMIYYQIKTKTDFRVKLKELEMDQIQEKETNGTFANMLTTGLYCIDLYEKNISNFQNVTNLLAWDAVRLINISRWALICGYINQDEFYQYISQVEEPVQSAYDDWTQVAIAYAIAGILWSPSEERANALAIPFSKLLKDKRSLINQCCFK